MTARMLTTMVLAAGLAGDGIAADPYSAAVVQAYRQSRPQVPTGLLEVVNDYTAGANGRVTLEVRHPDAPDRDIGHFPLDGGFRGGLSYQGRELRVGLDWGVRVIFGNGVRSPVRLLADVATYRADGRIVLRATAVHSGARPVAGPPAPAVRPAPAGGGRPDPSRPILLPASDPQDDTWGCGPNSFTRVLRFYGHSVSYAAVRATTQRSFGILPDNADTSRFKTGTEPHELREVARRWEGDRVRLERKADFARLREVVQSGKPAVVLLRIGSFKPAGVLSGTWPKLHWVTVTAVDDAAGTVGVVETDGNYAAWPADYFRGRWNWSIGGGLASEVLHRKGVHTSTMLWIDR